ncbi:hypothetical protein [Streptomyces avidinii]|uniref:Uncharacterized protein n=1 Tax=Streptomyces avidinii TaxID=1895 RepID=A0ABS4KXF2_STRAV|nr:hypothetical protein [Streptomyces avidinii]MBP2034720.1 hypothetical protein [Streptomyces avidinii]
MNHQPVLATLFKTPISEMKLAVPLVTSSAIAVRSSRYQRW